MSFSLPSPWRARLRGTRVEYYASSSEFELETSAEDVIVSSARPSGPARFCDGDVASTYDGKGNVWKVKIEELDPQLGSYECMVVDYRRTTLRLFEADLFPGDTSFFDRAVLASGEVVRDVVGVVC